MVVNCPHCGKQLRLGEKIRASIEKLPADRKVKIKCSSCGEPFSIDRQTLGKDVGPPRLVNKDESKVLKERTTPPPLAPDIEWLREGKFEDREIVEDIPRALVLFPEAAERELYVKAAEEFGYLVELKDSPEEAIDSMRFMNYAAVFLHDQYEQGGVVDGKFHHYMRRMDMSRRRYVFYVLIGAQFATLYDLQALAFSANLVINTGDAEFVNTILRKTIPDYEALFGPMMESLRLAGK